MSAGSRHWWFAPDAEGRLEPMEHVGALKGILERDRAALSASHLEEARDRVLEVLREEEEREAQYREERERRQLLVLHERARHLLARAAACWAGDSGFPIPPDEAVAGVRRLGYPWAPLLKLAGRPEESVVEMEMRSVSGAGGRKLELLKAEAQELLNRLARAQQGAVGSGQVVSEARSTELDVQVYTWAR
ncbi:MAG: hypothetical protein IBX71_10600 [Candidatus Desulforudis sp.]|nr:hypothetical protein [Desulforudis sp.]